MSVRVIRELGAAMRHEVEIRDHHFPTDVGTDEGGEDTGPSPHDLYDAALGACKALTVLWYAKRKSIPVERIEVTVERDAGAERDGIYRLSASLLLGGELSAAQRAELLAVAGKCPVHKLMTQVKTEITTSLLP